MVEGLFIIGDWGTTRLRLALCDSTHILERKVGPGISVMTELPQDSFLALTESWRTRHGPLPAYLCGMVGSRMGWREAPYVSCPADPVILRQAAVSFSAAGCPISIVPGLTCTNPLGAPDVMRGEESQILGAVASHPQLAKGRYLLGLPGTHTKWVALEDGRVRTFMTTPTGEFYALLNKHSTLTKAAAVPDTDFGFASSAGFLLGLERHHEIAGTAGLLQTLFEVRTRQLIDGLSPADAVGFMSGLLIGGDVGGALRCFDRTDAVYLIGDPDLSRLFTVALGRAGIVCATLDGTDCAFQGLRSIFAEAAKV